MKKFHLGALALAWILMLPASPQTKNFRIEHCCYNTQEACEAALQTLKRPGSCEMQKLKPRPNDSRVISSSAQPASQN